MAVGARLTWLVMLVACGGEDHSHRAPTELEAAISSQFGARARMPMHVTCSMAPPHCVAIALDGRVLPIVLGVDRGEWTWRVDGLFVRADEVERLVLGALDEIGVTRTVDCGPRLRVIPAEGRVECMLEGRGRAFVVVHADGSTALELVLDPAAAAARATESSPAEEQSLEAASHALEAGDEADAEEQ
jgi:hypothetical protein